MSVEWSPHRFSGGVLALDVANTIVLRNDPKRRLDRFAEPAEVARFAIAASRYRFEELGGRQLSVESLDAAHGDVLRLRGATDDLFRGMAASGHAGTIPLSALLRACAMVLESREMSIDAGLQLDTCEDSIPFEAALSASALSLLAPARMARIRICANCDWLFLDSSRNGSRIWCDMAVCGNRHKARRHYDRTRRAEVAS